MTKNWLTSNQLFFLIPSTCSKNSSARSYLACLQNKLNSTQKNIGEGASTSHLMQGTNKNLILPIPKTVNLSSKLFKQQLTNQRVVSVLTINGRRMLTGRQYTQLLEMRKGFDVRGSIPHYLLLSREVWTYLISSLFVKSTAWNLLHFNCKERFRKTETLIKVILNF